MSELADRTILALAEPTRLRIVELLSARPQRVGDMARTLEMSGPAISRHLRVLRVSRVIEEVRLEEDARVRIYQLRQEPFAELHAWIERVESFWTGQLWGVQKPRGTDEGRFLTDSVTPFVCALGTDTRVTSFNAATASVTTSIEVSVDPITAFDIFTKDVDAWWQRGPMNWNNPDRAVGVRFEPGVGGRWLEVHDAATGEGFEMGRISIWKPGEQVVFSYRDVGHDIDGTEVDIRFVAVPGGTRVTVEHRGWEGVARSVLEPKIATKRWGWANILTWYGNHVFQRTLLPHSPNE